MDFKEVLNFKEYNLQRIESEFSDALIVSSADVINDETIVGCLKILAENLGQFISKQGYKPSKDANVIIKVPCSGCSTADPTNRFATIGGKVKCDLTATKDQYIYYASKVIDELKAECKRQIEKTWKDRLVEHLDLTYIKKLGLSDCFLEEADRDLDYFKKRDRFIKKIEKLLGKFEENL